MNQGRPGRGPLATEADTVFFLSDYGRHDEFVGVVHAVLRRLAHDVAVIDLTHDVAPYDVRAGAAALERAVPHLGPGVVLAVVDPGVGGRRRGLVIEVAPEADGPRWFVGPDNGLLVPAVDRCGGAVRVVALESPAAGSATFDGRDVFAPAVAAICRGVDLARLGQAIERASLVDTLRPVWSEGRLADGRRLWRSEVTWVDRFGNAQLALPGTVLAGVGAQPVLVEVERRAAAVPAPDESAAGADAESQAPAWRIRVVRFFADLERGEPGLLVDANGHVALVVREGSACSRLGLSAGGLVNLLPLW